MVFPTLVLGRRTRLFRRACAPLSTLAFAVLAALAIAPVHVFVQSELRRGVGSCSRHAVDRMHVNDVCVERQVAPLVPGLSRFQAVAAAIAAGDLFPSTASAVEPDQLQALLPALIFVLVAGAGLILSSDSAAGNVDDKKVVEKYFNNEGFERWNKIYGETDDVNAVQKDIRVGHAETVGKVLRWLDGDAVDGKSVCDAGCGTGNLSIPLASRGALVSGSDISEAMATEATRRAKVQLENAAGVKQMPNFSTRDLEKLDGKFDYVCCVDVLIHYPPSKLEGMVGHLASLSQDRLILSFAPKTWYYTLLKRIGELFPGKSKTTRAYLHEEEVVEQALRAAGFEITRREMTSTNFYFSRLLEAQPVKS